MSWTTEKPFDRYMLPETAAVRQQLDELGLTKDRATVVGERLVAPARGLIYLRADGASLALPHKFMKRFVALLSADMEPVEMSSLLNNTQRACYGDCEMRSLVRTIYRPRYIQDQHLNTPQNIERRHQAMLIGMAACIDRTRVEFERAQRAGRVFD